MVKIKAKVTKFGGSYHVLIPKALVSCDVLEAEKEYDFVIKETEVKEKEPENSEPWIRASDHQPIGVFA